VAAAVAVAAAEAKAVAAAEAMAAGVAVAGAEAEAVMAAAIARNRATDAARTVHEHSWHPAALSDRRRSRDARTIRGTTEAFL
jgi:hypothetical protein